MNKFRWKGYRFSIITLVILALGFVAGATPSSSVLADHTQDPATVTLAGSFQSELGCPGDWQPECSITHLVYDPDDDVWQGSFTIPAGNWEYKAALNGSWDENYGANAIQNGPNISLSLGETTTVKFYYDHKSHWITDNVNSVIATAPGNFQSELGCPGDWQPDCLRSWLQDLDGDGVFTFATRSLPAGAYEVKVAISESWDENYGAGGVRNGPNIHFTVPFDGAEVRFEYNHSTHLLVVRAGHGHDDNVEFFGLGHNSHDTLYRVPFGAITPGTELILRFRTYHNDVTSVQVRFFDTATNREFFQNMEVVASDVSCYDPAQPEESCDFWETFYTPTQPTTLYYRFIIKDGSATAYYDDDHFQNGGWGEATPHLEDDSYAVTVYNPDFEAIPWLQDAVVYQIFPDRFRNGRSSNDPSPLEPRYDYPPDLLDQIIVKGWDDLPEGHCRFYQNPAQTCEEEPRGRDYFGGDLRGVTQRLNYLDDLGVTVIYFNPIFEAASNHAYDTQDYYSIDHFFGTQKDFEELVKHANRRGIRLVLDGVFNHVSSDSPYFDRYGHFDTLGACESLESPYRDWFFFRDVPAGSGPCVGSDGQPNGATYSAWFGFDSLPVLNKSNPEVRELIYAGDNAVARYWLNQGASGWRLDVMGDPSFPADFWPAFRQAVKATRADAPIIGELWKKHEVLAMVKGDMADTAMNYRFRNAILGFFGEVDNKGFADDGQRDQPPSLFASKMMSIREDNPDASYYTLLNLMGSHDTKRVLWSLTPGVNNREEKEFNPANLAMGMQILKLATVVQMTMPGAPAIYYGDEVGITGDDDPDDRRTFPWKGEGAFGEGGNLDLKNHTRALIHLRHDNPVFSRGELSFLLTDDANRTLAYLMRTADEAAVVAINRNPQPKTIHVDVSGRLPSLVSMVDALGAFGEVTAHNGILTLEMPGLSAAVLLPLPGQDLRPPEAPQDLQSSEGDGQVGLSWADVANAALYRVYRSPVSRGGFVPIAEVTSASFTDTDVVNGRLYYYAVSAIDSAGNESKLSEETSALPHYTIGWANLQWPPTITHTISAIHRTENIYGQVWIDGVTNQPGPTPGLRAQAGFGPRDSHPAGNPDWMWEEASFNVDVGNNDEFVASLLPEETGEFDYAYRYSTTNGRDWVYADLDGIAYDSSRAGKMTVLPSDDVTPPPVPGGLRVVAVTATSVELAWDPVLDDPTLFGYEVLRSDISGGPYTMIARVLDTAYRDQDVQTGSTYYYVVRSVDTSFNRSGNSEEVSAIPQRRTVNLTFNVTVPAHTPEGSSVYLAGTLDRLDGDLPQWDPGGVVMTQVDDTRWTITLSGPEGTNLEYKYTLGLWDFVEKGAICEELSNRTLVLDYGVDGNQVVEDVVLNWRNIDPCGD